MKIGIVGTGAGVMEILGGSGPAPIKDHISAPPVISGAHGKAWLCDLPEIRRRAGCRQEDDASIAHWVIEAPWAHPAWHSYSLVLVHLRDLPNKSQETTFYLADATHELWLFAIDPDKDRNQLLVSAPKGHWLMPMNFGAQFIEITDDLAIDRVRKSVELICEGKLSPDTDHLATWGRLYGTNMIKGASRLNQSTVRRG